MAENDEMTASRPYFIRALYDWLVDNNMTPHLLVSAGAKGVEVPQQYVEDGQVVLNIAPTAVKFLELGNELISFNARFGGIPTDIRVPPHAVLGIYARENGRGMLFPEGEGIAPGEAEGPDDEPEPPTNRPKLRVVK